MTAPDLTVFHRPRSVVIVGASNDPDKIGGRPIRYLREFGFAGEVYPVNPGRATVQGVKAFGDLDSLPSVPDVALIAVPGEAAAHAVARCAELGVSGCVIMSSGFGETEEHEGRDLQDRMLAVARGAGMRLVGPNTQGLADFRSGAVLGFSTMFIEEPPADGPVGIISQSGAMCSVAYGLLRRKGVGVRYAHATGNEADVSVGELAEAVLADPGIRLLLLYVENISDPRPLEQAAMLAARRDVPVVALVGGRSQDGKRAARSHTGALANEQRVVDAYLERIGIWRARDVRELVASTEMYLEPWHPAGRNLVVVSNSGASCVLAADAAADCGLPLATLAPQTERELEAVLPRFAQKANPVDVTAALLSDSTLVGKVLAPLAGDPGADACLFAMPVSGRGYDVTRFATDAVQFARGTGKPFVVTTPQPSVAEEFRQAGVIVFEEESGAVGALAQYLDHRQLQERARRVARPISGRHAGDGRRTLNEADSLDLLESSGLPTVGRALCADPDAAAQAFAAMGSVPVVLKGCTAAVTHKSEHGLVFLGLTTRDQVVAAAATALRRMNDQGWVADGVLVMPMVSGTHEVLLGAHVDPVFGPVVVVGAGGAAVEVLNDVQLLLAPFTTGDALRAIDRLGCAPLLGSVRGRAPADVEAWADMAVRLGDVMADPGCRIASVDANPVMLSPRTGTDGRGAVVVDAVAIVEVLP